MDVVVIVSRYIQMSNHDVVHLKLTLLCIISQNWGSQITVYITRMKDQIGCWKTNFSSVMVAHD